MRTLPAAVAMLSAFATAQAPLDVNQAVRLSMDRRDTIQAALARVRAAENTRSALGAYPATRLEAGYGTAPDVGTGNDFMLAQPVDLFGKSRAARATGEAGVRAARASLLQTELDVQASVIDAFADLQDAQALVQTGQDIADLAQKSYDATKLRIQAGDLPPAQLVRADLELQRAKQTLALRKRTVEAARTRFAAAVGIDPAQVGAVSLDVPNAPGRANVDQRPDVMQIQADYLSARADQRVASLSVLPDTELEFSRGPWDTQEQYNFRVQFVIPLFDFGASRERRRAASNAAAAAQHALQDKRKTAQAEVQAALQDLEAAKEASAGFERLTSDAKTLLENEQKAFAGGAASLLDVIDASRALRDTEESAVDARLRWVQAFGKYLSATGTLLAGTR